MRSSDAAATARAANLSAAAWAELAFCAGGALCACALFDGLVIRSWPTPTAAALLALGFLAAFVRSGEAGPAWSLAGAAGAPALALLLLLPRAGDAVTVALGAVLAAVSLLLRMRAHPPGDNIRVSAVPALGFAAASTGAISGCLGLLWGHSLAGFCGTLSALLAGAAAARALRRAWRPVEPGAAALAAGLGLLLLLGFLRFLGINSAGAEHLKAAIGSRRDLLFLVLQGWAAAAAWSCAAGLTPAARSRRPGFSWATALAPLAAWQVWLRWGPACGAFAAALGWTAWGAWSCRRRLSGDALLRRAVAVGTAAALVLGWRAPRLFEDVWQTRLNEAYAGGRFVATAWCRGRSLGVYRFSTGLKALLVDGLLDGADGEAEAAFALSSAAGPRRVLLDGVLQPAAAAWISERATLRISDPCPEAAAVRDALDYRPATSTGAASAASSPYDAVLVEIPPGDGPESIRLWTQESLLSARTMLAPGGVLALRLPSEAGPRAASRIVGTARTAFRAVGLWRWRGLTVVLASESALPAQAEEMLARLPARLRDASWVYPAEALPPTPTASFDRPGDAPPPWPGLRR